MLKDSTGAKPVQKWATMGEGVFGKMDAEQSATTM
jgi:hypothetical protein